MGRGMPCAARNEVESMISPLLDRAREAYMSWVYTTLLSLVPLLAVSFSVLKAFGGHNQLTPVLLNFLSPLGENGVELGLRIVSFVENMKVNKQNTQSLAMLIYTVVS